MTEHQKIWVAAAVFIGALLAVIAVVARDEFNDWRNR